MNLERYRYVLRYYRQFEPELFKDICHNAYLNYWRNHHADLFDQDIPFIFRVVRNQGIDDWRKREQTNSRDYDPETYVPKEFISLSVNPESIKFRDLARADEKQAAFKRAILSRNNPYEEMVAKELLERCYQVMIQDKKTSELAVQILELKLAGYIETEIAKILGIDKSRVARFTKKLQMLNNPFNGSKVKITKHMSLSNWEKHGDEDYELEDYNEFYYLYKHKESGEGLLVKVPARRTNPYIK